MLQCWAQKKGVWAKLRRTWRCDKACFQCCAHNAERKSCMWLGNNGNQRLQLYMHGWKQRSRWNFHTSISVLCNTYSQTCCYLMIQIFGNSPVSALEFLPSVFWASSEVPWTFWKWEKYMKTTVLRLPTLLFFPVTNCFLDFFTHLKENWSTIFFSWCWGRCVNTAGVT